MNMLIYHEYIYYCFELINLSCGTMNILVYVYTGSIPRCPHLYACSNFMAALNRRVVISTNLYTFQKLNIPVQI